jgi:DNA modification methylase
MMIDGIKNNKIQLNNIYNEDCNKLILKMIKKNIKVDLILTDPPYNISRENNFKSIGRSGIDFGK